MKIGILTLPLHTNIGGILQAYALQCVLERLGHSVVMLIEKPSKFIFVKRIKRKIFDFFKGKNQKDKVSVKKFIQTYFPLWHFFEDNLDCQKKVFDVVIVGSDQVWRLWSEKWNIYHYFFDFLQDSHVKKYAYAASFGVEKWMFSDSMTMQIKKLIKNFTKISVREQDAVNLCKRYLDVDAEWLLDPTMLLDKQDYAKLVKCGVDKNIGLVCYYIDGDEENESKLRNVLDATAKYFDNKWVFAQNQSKESSKTSQSAIENWLYNMMNASFIVTNSFHGVAFAINFEKPFIVLNHENGGASRIKSILSMFGLENRLVNNVDYVSKFVNEKIDWNNVSKIKTLYREKSLGFLRNI